VAIIVLHNAYDGYAVVKTDHDAHGNPIKAAVFGVNGKPTLNKDG
jgi:hypothetical protein